VIGDLLISQTHTTRFNRLAPGAGADAEAALAAELQEQCFLCDSPLAGLPTDSGSDDDNVAVCQHPEAPHRLARCMETLCVITSAEYWECPLCGAAARPHLPASIAVAAMDDDDRVGAWPFEKRAPWLAPFHEGGGVWCLFCHVPCRLLNT
jgi:hypothetical protein